MKKIDFLVIIIVFFILTSFFAFPELFEEYKTFNAEYPLTMAFIKFALLATFGEMLGLRIKTGKYNVPGFGLSARAVVWGFLGVWIALAMTTFKIGISGFLNQQSLFKGIKEAMYADFSGLKLCGAFFISLMMNFSFAPVFMTLHKITDTHILQNGGKLNALIKPVPIGKIITELNWKVQWGFVFKKTIPLFWIPAHTITFILPTDFQVLFAALCSIILGLILSIASLKK
jgi:hypothetical protein